MHIDTRACPAGKRNQKRLTPAVKNHQEVGKKEYLPCMECDNPRDNRGDTLLGPGPHFPLPGTRVYLRTFGCTYNKGDSWKLAEVLKARGCTLVTDPVLADAIVINTCIVVGKTERKILHELRHHAGRPLYVTGCMPLVQADAIRNVCDPVIIHPDEIHAAYAELNTVPHGPVGVVQACKGCLGSCSYCATRLARGTLVSRSLEDVTQEATRLVAAGAVEIRLTGQDLSAWGRDTGHSPAELLRSLDALCGRFMIRAGMMNPATLFPIMDEVAEAFLLPKVFAALHLPTQSGAENVLGRMRRGYTPEQVVSIVERFEREVPDLSLTTDIICGYPGETEDDFFETLALLQRIRPDRVIITRYSSRPGTRAWHEKDMPDRIKKERSRTLRVHAEEIARQKNARWKGRICPVMITEHIRHGTSVGRTREYRAVVLPGNHKPGSMFSVRILEDRTYYFTGEPV